MNIALSRSLPRDHPMLGEVGGDAGQGATTGIPLASARPPPPAPICVNLVT